MRNDPDYYVYVYIDPQNNEEFYYGKGRGNRKYSHLLAQGDSAKVKRIKAIQKEGEKPRIKVVATRLTAEQALLVESTLLWKLGKNLTNAVAGAYARNFRPQNTLHKELPGFDFRQAIHLVKRFCATGSGFWGLLVSLASAIATRSRRASLSARHPCIRRLPPLRWNDTVPSGCSVNVIEFHVPARRDVHLLCARLLPCIQPLHGGTTTQRPRHTAAAGFRPYTNLTRSHPTPPTQPYLFF